MSKHNEHIKQFLEYYCGLQIPPEYAVLIKGPWGSGKTHLIKETIDELEAKSEKGSLQFLYVSLYGVSSTEDIETKFFQILNPVLSSKSAVLAGRFAKGFLKGALKIDLDDDGKPDGTMSVSVPEIDLSDYLTDTKNCILVFDDLERCDIDLKALMGYINFFVEKEGYKAILIADEEVLSQKNPSGSDDLAADYGLAKEKLIGKTFKVEVEVSEVYKHLLNEAIGDMSVKGFLQKVKNKFIRLYSEAGYHNLRSLRKALLEVERLWFLMDEEVKSKEELVNSFFDLFFILSMEIYSGGIKSEEIGDLIGGSTISRRFESQKEKSKVSKFTEIEKKYTFDLFNTVAGVELWKGLFGNGFLIREELNSCLKNTHYFLQEGEPAWVTLWYFWEVEEVDFHNALKSVMDDYKARKFVTPGEIKHVGGILLLLSKFEIISDDVKTVTQNHLTYIRNVFKSGSLSVSIEDRYRESESDTYRSLQYTSMDTDEFTKISDFLSQCEEMEIEKQLKERAPEILEIVRTKPEDLVYTLCLSNGPYNPFSTLPVLKYVGSRNFAPLFMKASNKLKRDIIRVLGKRYEHVGSYPRLREEANFLKVLTKRLKFAEYKLSKGPTKMIVQKGRERLLEILDGLKS